MQKDLVNKKKINGWRDYAMLVFISLCFLFLIWGLFHIHYSPIRSSWEIKALEERGLEKRAFLYSTTYSSGTRAAETYTFRYSYEVDGKDYKRTMDVDASKYTIYEKGDSIPIKYLPENPKISDMPGNWANETRWMQMIIFDIIAVLIMVYFLFNYRKKKRKEKEKIQNEKILDADL